MKKYAVIVDAYSAGNLLAPEFCSREIQCIHVQSSKEVLPALLATFRAEDFSSELIYDNNLESLVIELSFFPILCILAGTETGVELADLLSERLELSGNGTLNSEARRNKFKMTETVRNAGLKVALQLNSTSAADITRWKKMLNLDRIVLKPLNSAGTDSVSICATDDEIVRGFNQIFGTKNKLGLANTAVLAQEFLIGTEYFLDTVSFQGQHHFTDIWKYQKRSINGHALVYDRNELMTSDAKEVLEMQAYVTKVLDALSIEYGPAHTEVIYTKNGPMLVEIGARLDGLSVPTVNREAIGYSPVDLTVDSFIDRKSFESKTRSPYPLKKHALTVYLASYDVGTVTDISGTEILKKLPSFFQMRLRVKEGGPIKKTVDYFTAPGFLSLVHEERNQIEKDYLTIRNLEQARSLFRVV